MPLPVLHAAGWVVGWLSFLLSPRYRRRLRENLAAMVMPAFVLGTGIAAVLMRHTRSSMLQVLAADYVRTARAKGASDWRVTIRHALRNAMIPVVTLVGLQIGFLLGGSIVTETMFAWPGVGSLMVDSVFQRDMPTVQGCILMIVLFFLVINTLVDIAYVVIDPRIRYR